MSENSARRLCARIKGKFRKVLHETRQNRPFRKIEPATPHLPVQEAKFRLLTPKKPYSMSSSGPEWGTGRRTWGSGSCQGV